MRPQRVTHVVTASCTGFEAPGPDQWLIWDLGLPTNCRRTNLGFMGCHAAINGLAVAEAFVRADPRAVVLMTAVEISTVHLHSGARMDRLIANALFADGSSSAVVAAEGPSDAPRIALADATLMPDSADEMAWRIGNNGFEMTLSSTVPAQLRREVGPWIRGVLARAGLEPAAVGGWAIHPGGPRIVEAIAEALGLPGEATRISCDVLRTRGNMSSATVLFVVRGLQDAGLPRPWMAMSFGPGLAGEALVIV
jgi:predicted naringenin-chalcone synthase